MSDSDIISTAVRTWQNGHPITDGQARVIAASWHGGGASALCALATSGAILESVTTELEREVAALRDVPEREEVEALLAYVEREGERGPVAGWSGIWG